MAEVIWAEGAVVDLNLIVAYIEQFNAAAADRIGDRLREAALSLASFPHRGRPVGQGHREMVTVPPFIIRYEVEGDTVRVLGVRHAARSDG